MSLANIEADLKLVLAEVQAANVVMDKIDNAIDTLQPLAITTMDNINALISNTQGVINRASNIEDSLDNIETLMTIVLVALCVFIIMAGAFWFYRDIYPYVWRDLPQPIRADVKRTTRRAEKAALKLV